MFFETGPEPEPTDRELVDRILAGGKDAQEILFRRYRNLIRRVTDRVIGRRPVSVQVVPQELWLRLLQDDFRVLREWRGSGSIGPYLAKVTCGVAVDYSRWKLRPWQVQFPEHSDGDSYAFTAFGCSREGNPYYEVAAAELRDHIIEAIYSLPDGLREILVLTEIKGLEIPEAARSLGIQVNAAYQRRFRAYRGLVFRLYQTHGEWFDFPGDFSLFVRKNHPL